ncbi:MAG: quinolinate synthetase, partial [Microbacterium sp.]|nr:quinolinate synthetase [Microbacterium sp.]
MSPATLTLQPRPIDPSVDHEIQAIVAGAGTASTCNTDLAAGPWTFDTRPGYGPGASMGDVIPTGHPEAEAMIFCGVHFMAETADLLSGPDQAVILPNLAAGCSMADMADIDQVEECWETLEDVFGDMDAPDADGLLPVIPVTYMNSSAAIKGFVGRHGGIVCTSSNARTVLEWAFARGRRVLFFPDQHLGRNTAKAMG